MRSPERLVRLRILAALMIVLLSPATSALAGSGNEDPVGVEQGREALNRLVQALDEQSYSGTFVYARAGIVETVRVVHRAGEKGRFRQRLEILTGPEREIVRTADGVRVAGVGHARNVHRQGIGGALGDAWPRADEIDESLYRIRLAGDGRVAGRAADVVLIEPLDQLRYGHRLWIDRESGLPLQAQLLEGSRVIERLLFTALELRDEIGEQELEPRLEVARELESVARERIEEEQARWHVPEPPSGFKLVGRSVLAGAEEREQRIEHLLFSDGLATVSIYIEAGGGGERGRARAGALHAFEEPIDDHHVTAIGDVPARTVERFATGVRPR